MTTGNMLSEEKARTRNTLAMQLLFSPHAGFTTVMIDMGEERLWQQDRWVNGQGMLKASQVKAVFGRLVREAIMEKRYR